MSSYEISYHFKRTNNRQHRYRLARRAREVNNALNHFNKRELKLVVDVGTADGMMLERLTGMLRECLYVGIDISFDLLRFNKHKNFFPVQGDAQRLPIKSDLADAIIATAIIEHVSSPTQLLSECCRILRPGGLLLLTTPVPLMEKLAKSLGILKDDKHHMVLTFSELMAGLKKNGFELLESKKFMFSPVGFPAEEFFEKVLCSIGLKSILANQMVVARKRSY